MTNLEMRLETINPVFHSESSHHPGYLLLLYCIITLLLNLGIRKLIYFYCFITDFLLKDFLFIALLSS